jgi:hypothetical protein
MTCPGFMSDYRQIVLGLSLGFCFCLSTLAQLPNQAGPLGSSGPSSPVTSALRPPLPKPPVELFRTLLGMTPSELRESLSSRTPDAQKLILAKVREYKALTPDQRELRLRVTELRWYLLPLLSTSPTNRPARLEAIPADLRQLVDDRLRQWDQLSGEAQKQVLDNESTARFYFDWAVSTPERRAETMTNMPPSVRENLAQGVRRWQTLTPEQRVAVLNHVKDFFDVTPVEKDKILGTLSEPERVQIEKTLRTFDGLSQSQRVQCLNSFEKFASLNPDERRQFLKNAERWKLMTPAERQSWRNLVANLSHQPPLPPGLSTPPPPPSVRAPSGSSNSSFLTNSN